MPHHAHYRAEGIRESLVEYDLAAGEEVFLSYAHGREYGPGIERTGKGPPAMEDLSPNAIPGSRTTHPVGQRLRTWLIQDEQRADDLQDIHKELLRPPAAAPPPTPDGKLEATDPAMVAFAAAVAALRDRIRARASDPKLQREKQAALDAARAVLARAVDRGLPRDAARVLGAFATENPTLDAHDRRFVTAYAPPDAAAPPPYEIIGQQGCGDLTMNLWCVAYLNGRLTPGPRPRLLFTHAEPIGNRTYPCLVKWKAVGVHPPRVSIEDLRFNPNAARVGGDPDEIVWVSQDGQPRPAGNAIEFAVSGKPIIRRGAVINLGHRTTQFTDLRHLLKLANLNPAKRLDASPGDTGRPRSFFARVQADDVWFGEAQLLADENYQRGAMQGPIILSRLYAGLGASVEHVRAALLETGYAEVVDPVQEIAQGQFRFLPADDTLVEIYFRRNTYAWNVIGLDRERSKIKAFACECRWSPPAKGHQLHELAERLRSDHGTHDAILFDEGQDVFQAAAVAGEFPKARIYSDPDVRPPYVNPDLAIIVPLLRKRVRACFIFAHPRSVGPPVA